MLYQSPQQLQKMITQLDQAIYNHEQWYKGLLRTLIARLPPEYLDLQLDAHHRCRFGQWYYSDETKPLRDHQAFVSLGKAHEQMHHSATHLLQRLADDLVVTPADIDSFHNMLDRLKLEMLSLRRELADAVQNRDPLTGARNRVDMLSDLREQHALVRRGVQQCAIIIVDLDHFKHQSRGASKFQSGPMIASTVTAERSFSFICLTRRWTRRWVWQSGFARQLHQRKFELLTVVQSCALPPRSEWPHLMPIGLLKSLLIRPTEPYTRLRAEAEIASRSHPSG